jgi:hypothetical protein
MDLEFDTMVRIGFTTKQSRFSVLIQPDSFKEVADLMMKADANEAIKAFGAAMLNGVNSPKNSN